MKCPFMGMMVCGSECALRVKNKSGEFQCVFCSLHTIDTYLERISWTLALMNLSGGHTISSKDTIAT